MNTTNSLNRFSLLLSAAILLAAGAFWWMAESRAQSAPDAAAAHPSVQDSAPAIDLDTKIFLHRNGALRVDLPTLRV